MEKMSDPHPCKLFRACKTITVEILKIIIRYFSVFITFSFMVLMLDGYSKKDAAIMNSLCYLICSRHLIRSRAITNRLLSFMRALRVLIYFLIKVQCCDPYLKPRLWWKDQKKQQPVDNSRFKSVTSIGKRLYWLGRGIYCAVRSFLPTFEILFFSFL